MPPGRFWWSSEREKGNTIMATVLDHRRAAPKAPRPADRIVGWLAPHGIDILRVCLGLIIAGFGVLKFFPSISPAEPLVTHAVDMLTFGVITGQTAMVATAIVECTIGIMLISGRFLRTGLILLAGCALGWMSPLVLFPADLFAGGPTLEAQYILKDIVLGAAGLVVAAKALGARMVVE
jgi:putative oxidoreductase